MPDLAPPPPEPPPAPRPRLPFRLPADYYGSPDAPPRVFPRLVPFGCGGAAIVFLVLLFGAGMTADRFMPALFGYMQSEIDGQFTKDVPAAQRAAFDKEFSTLIARMRNGKAKMAGLQPFLEKMRDASMDDKITPEETKAMTDALRQINGKR
jgi:hypothetical protein